MQDEDFSDSAGRPSKTKKKEAMHELQDLGAELVELSVGQLKRINLPENIYEAVRECQKITAHGARRRQLQYLGKLMRSADEAALQDALQRLAVLGRVDSISGRHCARRGRGSGRGRSRQRSTEPPAPPSPPVGSTASRVTSVCAGLPQIVA